MNSPGCHVPGSNTNMTRGRPPPPSKKSKQKNVRPMPNRIPGNPIMRPAPAAYAAVTGRSQTQYPVLAGANGRCVVKNFEQVAGISGSATFSGTAYFANPMNPTSFPWLYTIASNYTKFRFLSLRWIWTPICSTATTGSVFLYIKYDYADANPDTLARVNASDTSCSGNAWFGTAINQASAFSKNMSTATNIYVEYDCERASQPWYYCRTNSILSTTGVALSGTPTGGIGTLAVSQGDYKDDSAIPCYLFAGVDTTNPSSGVLGYVYAAYEVEFADPVSPGVNA